MQPDQKAQASQPYTIDIFTTIQAEAVVTFTQDNDKVTISADGIQPHTMSAATFDQFFKYYKQADLFSTPAQDQKSTATEQTQAAAINTASNTPAAPGSGQQQPTKTAQVVFIANGENAGTYGPLCFLESFPTDKDINEKCQRFISWDFNEYMTVDLYRIREIVLPAWMTEQEFLTDHIKYKFAIGLAYDFVMTLNRDQWNKFKNLSEKYQYFIDEYFKGNTKNSFKQSLRAQIIEWLNSPYDYKKQTPLSPRQWEIATQYIKLYNADKISSRIYNSNF